MPSSHLAVVGACFVSTLMAHTSFLWPITLAATLALAGKPALLQRNVCKSANLQSTLNPDSGMSSTV